MADIRHGVWLFNSALPLSDSRLWREDDHGYWAETPFTRALGIRSGGATGLLYSGVLGELRTPRHSLSALLKELFGGSLAGVQPVIPSEALASQLRAATGFAVLAAPTLRLRSVSGLARLVAVARVRPQDEP